MTLAFWKAQGTQSRTGRGGGSLTYAIEGNLLCNKVVGYFDQALADEIMGRGSAMLAAHGRLAVFSDWFEMTSYDTSCRRTMTAWGAGMGKGMECFHVIAGSRMVKMGLAVASIVVPALHAHDDMKAFAAAYEQVRTRALPRR